MSQRHGKSISTLRRRFEGHSPTAERLRAHSSPVALSFDATFFGRGYGLLVYRAGGRNIHWQEIESETMVAIEQGLLHLHAEGWRFSTGRQRSKYTGDYAKTGKPK